MEKILIENDYISYKDLEIIVDSLRAGGVIIYPTDSVYGMACDSQSKSGYEKLCRVKGVKPQAALFSLVCADFKQISAHAHQINNSLFRIMKKNLPGPFTFIIKSGNSLPKTMTNRKQTIGVRYPDHALSLKLIEQLGRPLISTSLKKNDDHVVIQDPAEIENLFQHEVDYFIDDDLGGIQESTIVDCVEGELSIIREGAQELKI